MYHKTDATINNINFYNFNNEKLEVMRTQK